MNRMFKYSQLNPVKMIILNHYSTNVKKKNRLDYINIST